jgi:hypothetical protein
MYKETDLKNPEYNKIRQNLLIWIYYMTVIICKLAKIYQPWETMIVVNF